MPDSASMPVSSSSTAYRTTSSHGVPAGTVRVAPAQAEASGTSTPERTSRTTTPSNPASETSRLDPPPTTSSGSPSASAVRTVSSSSASVVVSTYRRAGPPTRRVVRSASVVAAMRTAGHTIVGGTLAGEQSAVLSSVCTRPG